MGAGENVSRSGTKWTEAHYTAKGYGTVKFRLPLDVLELLASKAEAVGLTRAQLVDSAIRAFEVK